jgi:glutamate-1-semialdehyde 2,1-aminomutase
VMGAMSEFLRRLETQELQAMYRDVWDARAARLNKRLNDAQLPIEVRNLHSIFTLVYTQPGRYNWMLQYYLRAAGLMLSWVGTGRFIFSLDYTDAQFEAVGDRLIEAARQMQLDGFFFADPALTNKKIRRRILRETIAHKF